MAAYVTKDGGTADAPVLVVTVGNGKGSVLDLAGSVTVTREADSKGRAQVRVTIPADADGAFVIRKATDAVAVPEDVHTVGTKAIRTERAALDPDWSAFVAAITKGLAVDGGSVQVILAGTDPAEAKATGILAARLFGAKAS